MSPTRKETVVLALVSALAPLGCSLIVAQELDDKSSAGDAGADASQMPDASDASDGDVATPDAADGESGDDASNDRDDAPIDSPACTGCAQDECCNGVCTQLDSDPDHCGACDQPCPSERSCAQGMCSSGWVAMSGPATSNVRLRACAVWTGVTMFVWGGVDGDGVPVNTGDLYDPITDTWTTASTLGAPAPRDMPTCLAAGSRVFVWGGREPVGSTLFGDGAMYDPASDTWEALPTDKAPVGRLWPAAVWTGTHAIVWGGELTNENQTKTGAMFDPALGQWTVISIVDAPPRNKRTTPAWTGGTMLTFGGRDDGGGNVEQSLFGFAPTPNLWAPEVKPVAPGGRSNAFGAWTGSSFLLWGGLNAVKWALGDGGLYDPSTKTWTYLTAETASATRAAIPYETGWSAWIGSTFVIMGGTDGVGTTYADGLQFDPEAPIGSRWTDIPAWAPAGPHLNGVGVWTGQEFIIWGGTDGSSPMVDGSRWMP